MEPLVSVIIPNYNSEHYLKKCIESVEKQTYGNIEVIVVDDGSTDVSVAEMEQMCAAYNNISVFRQSNLNAAMARNRGLEVAKGKYLLFLDSDDILYEDGVFRLVTAAERCQADLVIGNYHEIDTSDRLISECRVVNLPADRLDPMTIVGTVPNPSNKLYVKAVVDANDLVWGNVRIGQDLNFFLKYLSCCKNVSTIASYIYGWRKVQGSISNSYNFKIFDIAESFKDTKHFYCLHGKEELYTKYVSAIEYRHYYLQMEKQKYYPDKRMKKAIVAYFSVILRDVDLTGSENIDTYQSDIIKCRLKLLLKHFYISKLYAILDDKFARKNKRKIKRKEGS